MSEKLRTWLVLLAIVGALVWISIGARRSNWPGLPAECEPSPPTLCS